MRLLSSGAGQRLVMESPGASRIDGERKLVGPAEFKSGHAHEMITQNGARNASGDVRRMRGYAEGGHAFTHVIGIRQSEMLLWRDVAEHAVPAAAIMAPPMAAVIWS